MSATTISPRGYGLILFILLLLTMLTVAVSFLNIRGGWHVGAGLLIALMKASLVVLFFMHVIHSSVATRAVIVVTLFWLVGVLLTLTFADYTSRETIPFSPGH
jgi:cytochrome c oxidase subunit 4